MTYSERWHSDDDNVTYPGSIAVALKLASTFMTFIDTPRLGEELFLTIRIDAANQAFIHMGPHGNGEWHWDPKRQNPIAVLVHELGYAPEAPIA